MGRRGEHSAEEYREMTLAAAEKIVAEEGVARLTARHLTSTIGYTAGSLYLIFKNLDDIITQLNERTLIKIHDALRKSLESAETPTEKIHAAVSAYMLYALGNQHCWRLVFEHQPTAKGISLTGTRKQMKLLIGLFEKPLQELSSNGKASFHATTLWMASHGILSLALSEKIASLNTAELKSKLTTFVDYYLCGLSSAKK